MAFFQIIPKNLVKVEDGWDGETIRYYRIAVAAAAPLAVAVHK